MKLSKFYPFIFFFLISPSYVLAQNFIYPKGVYMNIEEIVEKNPSRYHDLEILLRTEGDITMNGGNDYKIISKDRQLKKSLSRIMCMLFLMVKTFMSTGHNLSVRYGTVKLNK